MFTTCQNCNLLSWLRSCEIAKTEKKNRFLQHLSSILCSKIYQNINFQTRIPPKLAQYDGKCSAFVCGCKVEFPSQLLWQSDTGLSVGNSEPPTVCLQMDRKKPWVKVNPYACYTHTHTGLSKIFFLIYFHTLPLNSANMRTCSVGLKGSVT